MPPASLRRLALAATSGALAAVLCAAAPKDAMDSLPVMPKVRAALDEAFARKKLAGDRSPSRSAWEVALTPVFPAAWPPDGKAVFYGYATAFSFQLTDARLTGGLWAEARVDGGRVALADVRSAVKDLGPQGFEPIAKDEPVVALERVAQEKLLAAKAVGDLDEDVRRFYCQWRQFNGVIAREVEPLQKAFFAWLACK